MVIDDGRLDALAHPSELRKDNQYFRSAQSLSLGHAGDAG
jgi:hypothetical protein